MQAENGLSGRPGTELNGFRTRSGSEPNGQVEKLGKLAEKLSAEPKRSFIDPKPVTRIKQKRGFPECGFNIETTLCYSRVSAFSNELSIYQELCNV